MRNIPLALRTRQTASSIAEAEAYLTEFRAQFPTDAEAMAEIFKALLRAGLIRCRYCDAVANEVSGDIRTMECAKCGRKCWCTGSTFFRGIRRPAAWLFAIRLIEKGIVISANQFHHLIGIAYSSALGIFKRLAVVLEGAMASSIESVSSAEFLDLVCKRSANTPEQQHPRAEQEAITRDVERDMQNIAATLAGLSADELDVFDCLNDEPIQFEKLLQHVCKSAAQLSAALVVLELNYLVTRLPGDRFIRAAASADLDNLRASQKGGLGNEANGSGENAPSGRDTARSPIGIVHDVIKSIFHGVSRKYLQQYIAFYWVFAGGMQLSKPTLLEYCLHEPYTSGTTIKGYVSPTSLKVPQICPVAWHAPSRPDG